MSQADHVPTDDGDEIEQAWRSLRERLFETEPPWTRACDVANDDATLAAWLLQDSVHYVDMDAKARAAMLVGTVATGLARALAEVHLAGWSMHGLTLDRVRLRLTPYRWNHGGRSGVANRLDVDLDARPHFETDMADAPIEASARRQVHAFLSEFFAPVIRRLVGVTRLPAAAMWRVAADGLAFGYLEVGETRGETGRAMTEASSLIATRPSPLFNRQTGFISLAPGEIAGAAAGQHHWFVDRGGCCRTYTCAGQVHCVTCCLLPRDERRARLTGYLQHDAGVGTAA